MYISTTPIGPSVDFLFCDTAIKKFTYTCSDKFFSRRKKSFSCLFSTTLSVIVAILFNVRVLMLTRSEGVLKRKRGG